MIDTSQLSIQKLVVHHIGSHSAGEQVRLSKKIISFQGDDPVTGVLTQYFFKPFKTEAYFNFVDKESGEPNLMQELTTRIFEQPDTFYDTSLKVANLLFESSNHPNIKSGEFYMALIKDCVVDGELVDAIGIFKSENRETYLKVYLHDQNFEIGTQEGINIKKLDKGCLIFNTEKEDGYKICSVDNINKGNDARFWMDDFLGLKPREDKYYFTNNYLNLCKDFVGEVFNEENDVPRTDQIDMLNRSMDFFSKNDNFNEQRFENEVIMDPEVVDAFRDYKTFFENEKSIPLQSEFDISKSAVKQEKRFFKSVLKLDKNFHVYIHGKRQYVEQGYDQAKGLKFYKLYYEVES